MKEWYERNKNNLLFAWGVLGTAVSIIVIIFAMLMTEISIDLSNKVDTLENQIAEPKNTIPLKQYIEDVDRLESIIRDLRVQCETYNNK